jgi:hypothetical protein
MRTHKWIGYGREKIKRFFYLKDIPSQPGIGITPIKINTGLHGICYALKHGDKIQLENDEWVKVFQATLQTHGAVIGPHDAEAAKNSPCADVWRGAFHQRNIEKLKP